METSGKEGDMSDFNTALACGYRLHYLLIESNQYSRALQFIPWRLTLDTIYREIKSVLSDKEITACDAVRVKSDAACNLYIKEQGSNQWPTGTTSNRFFASTYKALNDFENQLRKSAERHGLLHKKSEDKGSVITQ